MFKDPFSKPAPKKELTIPIYSPRTAYNNIRSSDEALLGDLTLNFDPFTINILKNEFKLRKGAMQIVDFVLILKEHLLTWQKDLPFREKKLIRILVMLFEEIDLNGNRLLEWDEFTNYIIEKATVLNSMKIKEEEIKNYTTTPFKVNRKFLNLLTKVIYIPDIDRLAMFEEGSDEIYFANHETGTYNPKPLKVAPPKDITLDNHPKIKEDEHGKPAVHAEKSMILDMIHIQDAKTKIYYLITSSNDGALRIWKNNTSGYINANSEENEALYTGEAQVCLAWDPNTQTVYSGQRKGGINAWTLSSMLINTEKKNETEAMKTKRKKDALKDGQTFDSKDIRENGEIEAARYRKKRESNKDTEPKYFRPSFRLENGHSEVIMDIVPMSKVQMLATCSLDKSIILWHGVEHKKLRVYKEHEKGVVSLTFNESLILLVSAGYDHQICIWNPYIDNPIFKITSHNFPLISVKFVEGTSHFVSLDTSGTVKVWDFRKFNCIQTFTVEAEDEKHKLRPQGFTYISKPLKLAFAGRTLFIFEHDKHYNPNSVDDVAVVKVCYRPLDNTIITPAGNKVKVWNSLNGDVKKIFADVTQAEITTFALDHLKKRCLIGFSDGEAAAFNIMNGAKVKSLGKHQGEVNFIFEAHNLNLIITASSVDGTIRMHNDTEINEAEERRAIVIEDQIISSLAYKFNEKMLIVGTRNGPISFWESETAKCIGQCKVFSEEITNICPLRDLEYVIVGTAQGKICIVATPPAPFRYSKVYEFINYDAEDLVTPVYIQDMVWSEKIRTLFIADEKSYVKRLDLSVPIAEIIEQKKSKDKKLKDNMAHLNPPVLSNNPLPIMWSTKAHNEAIKAIEYVEEENLIFSTGLDKKVKIWNSEDGKYIDSLQQKYNKEDAAVIAYKKPGTEGLFGPDTKTRVDREFTKLSQEDQDEYFKKIKAAEKERQQKEEDEAWMPLYRTNKPSREDSVKSGWQKDQNKMVNSEVGGKKNLFGALPNNNEGNQNEASASKKVYDQNRLLEHWVFNSTSADERPHAIEELEKEVFDPYYNWNKVDLSKLSNTKSTQWKVNVNFDKNQDEFESFIVKIKEEIEAIEKEEREKEEREGKTKIGEQFKMKGFEVEEPVVPKQRAQTAIESIKREPESSRQPEAKKEDMFRSTMTTMTNKNSSPKTQKTILKKESNWAMKSSTMKSPSNLYRTELKGKILDKNRPAVSLSQDEVSAAYKLAAALSNYDKDDTRNLKFSEIQVKQQMKKSENRKDFIDYNMQHLTEFAGSSSLKNGILDIPNQLALRKAQQALNKHVQGARKES